MALPDLSSIPEDWLTGHVFQFEAGPDRTVISSTVTFDPGGRIGGYAHPNESRWRIEGERLIVQRDDGEASCAARLRRSDRGALELSGPFLLGRAGHEHYFRPVGVRAERHVIRTFDLFDTLIARECVFPPAVFDAVERHSRVVGFAELRREAEGALWGRREYSFDDIYTALATRTGWSNARIEQLKMLELAEEWDNIFPIAEMTALVRLGDMIISDMYLPMSFLRRLVDEKCGLPGVSMHVENYGKQHGKVWPGILATHRIERHYGDNEFADIAQARRWGIEAEHVTVSDWSRGESILVAAGLAGFARIIRRARLSTTAATVPLRRAQLAQFEVNMPFLTVAGIALLKHAERTGADTLLMCGRDCNLWVGLVRWLAGFADRKLAIHYFPSSRDLFTADNAAYLGYFCRLRGNRTILVDLGGSGRTPTRFIANAGARADTSIYIALKSDPADSDPPGYVPDFSADTEHEIDIDILVSDSGKQVLFEKLNATTECRAVDADFTGREFSIIRESDSHEGGARVVVETMREAFAAALSLFRDSAMTGSLSDYDDDRLLRAALEIVGSVARFEPVVAELPE
jgi:hypothetical protein